MCDVPAMSCISLTRSILPPILDDQTVANLFWMMRWDKNVSVCSGSSKTNIMSAPRFETSNFIVLMAVLQRYRSTFVSLLWCCLCVEPWHLASETLCCVQYVRGGFLTIHDVVAVLEWKALNICLNVYSMWDIKSQLALGNLKCYLI